MEDQVRANEFDGWVGLIQTLHSIQLGVGKSILDIGCGIGQFTPLFLNKFERVIGLDPSIAFLEEARKVNNRVEYLQGYGETFSLDEKFDTIIMNNLLEHVDDPVEVFINCKTHLAKKGRIIVQVPNSESVTRRLGVLMNLIDNTDDISEKERNFYGHKRVYTLKTLEDDCKKAGLKVIAKGGILYKPLPNEMLLKICKEQGQEWTEKFLDALVEFGKDRPEECAQIYCVCQ